MFISSIHDRYKDQVIVWERNPETGERVCKRHACSHYFYIPDENGQYLSITGEKLKKLEFASRKEFETAARAAPIKFESDISPQERIMTDKYSGMPVPKLVSGFVDIEVSYDSLFRADYLVKIDTENTVAVGELGDITNKVWDERICQWVNPEDSCYMSTTNRGWPRPNNPYGEINSLTIYRTDIEQYKTFCIPPQSWIESKMELPEEMKNNYFICDNEKDLLRLFIEEIENVDILIGWNSDFFDLPYIAKRLEIQMGPSWFNRLEFPGSPAPRWDETVRFAGSDPEIILRLNSRVHIDYMRLFQKFNLDGRSSYALASIADDELELPKMTFDGSLKQLYEGTWVPNLEVARSPDGEEDLYMAQYKLSKIREELRASTTEELIEAEKLLSEFVVKNSFIKYITYNKVDVEIMVQLDDKYKYIDLANEMVHESTVNFGSIFGSVALIDTAIINFCHNNLNKIIFDKKSIPAERVEGALVVTPSPGLYKWIGSVDLASLYPSTIRAINLSPEKIVGQLMGFEEDWNHVARANKNPDNDLYQLKTVTLRLEGLSPDDDISIPCRDLIEFMKEHQYSVSAYGTLLDQSTGEGLLPAVLSYWFASRKEMQAERRKFIKVAETIIDQGLKLSHDEVLALHKMSL